MTVKEAFRVGFLSRVAERGLTPSGMEKHAIMDFLSTLSPLAIAAFVGIPAATGILTGWAHADANDITEDDVERLKQQDVLDTYRSETRRIRRKLQRSRHEEQAQARPSYRF